MPRPKALNDAITERVVGAVRKGCSIQEAAESAGIAEVTLHHWLTTGRAHLTEGTEETREAILAGLVEDARAEWREALLDRITRAKDWKALAWSLEREQKVRLGAAKIANIKARTRYLKQRADAEASLAERLRLATDEELREALKELQAQRSREPAPSDDDA